MISDLDLARLELDTYAAEPVGDVIDTGIDRLVLTRFPDLTVASVKGTTTPAEWISNFKVVGVKQATHPQLGICESGFLSGGSALWDKLLPEIDPTIPLLIQGHSRGAGMVPILAGLAFLEGIRPVRCVCWEAPWAVGAQSRALLVDAGIDGVQYWHGDDPVPCAPAVPWLVPNVWPIRHFGSWMIDPFACHAMEGIVETLDG